MNMLGRIAIRCAAAASLISLAAVASAEERKIGVDIGYQWLGADELSFPVGIKADVVAALARGFAFVAEVGWSRNSSREFGFRQITTTTAAAGGVRWSLQRFPVRPFGQLLIGADRETVDIERFGSDSSSSVLVQPGAGIVVHFDQSHAVFGQVDLRRVPRQSERPTQVRLAVGVRFWLF